MSTTNQTIARMDAEAAERATRQAELNATFARSGAAAAKTAAINLAEFTHAALPQYAGHWDGAEWVLVRVLKPCKTKMGVAFEAGDVTIAHVKDTPAADTMDGKGFQSWMAHSFRNRCDTSLGRGLLGRVEVIR